MTKKEAAIISAYTGILIGDFDEYIEQLIRFIGSGIPVCMGPTTPLDEDLHNRLCWELGTVLRGEVKNLEARVEAARCTESLSRYIKLHGYRGDRDV